ncbi:SDR family NAD(P)-dependent oxidoreductase [Ottowia thiooxydans]|uniref:SDR family NAD(P)-dependent oxidoreductase n=1 Tax=Ottowia thiooxydans TaxID=219182 RepID=UPI00041FAF83|nr:glucose 1-dehydrogenase [Ottowia thiooxydans]
MLDFSDKIVFITGASGGLGGQMARDFARAGASLVVHNYGLADATQQLCADLSALGTPHLLVEGDLTDQAVVQAMVKQIDETFGRLDVLVNNAGASPDKMPFPETPAAIWDKIVAINLRSVFLVTQSCLPLLERSKRGRIINISSTAARNGGAPGGAAYATAKGAVSTLTKAFAKDFCAKGILVNAVAPGLIDTPFYGDVNVADKYAERLKTIPLRRVGAPGDIAGPVLFLASPLADYITGEVLEVSGGLSLMA